MTKDPTPTEMSKGQSDKTNNATKSSITQRLRTDLGRSVGVTTATQLVWLTGLRAQPSHCPQEPCNQKGTQIPDILFPRWWLGHTVDFEGVWLFPNSRWDNIRKPLIPSLYNLLDEYSAWHGFLKKYPSVLQFVFLNVTYFDYNANVVVEKMWFVNE